jgi:hypothetical protein
VYISNNICSVITGKHNMTKVFCFYLPSLKALSLQSVIAYIALVLAYYAYRKSVLDKYESWKSLLRSFQQELLAQRSWFDARYSESYVNKQFINPYKIVFSVSFESAKEITRRGIGSLSFISEKLENQIAMFNQRVEAFNSLLDHQKRVITADPVLSQELSERLKGLESANPNASLNDFFQLVSDLRNSKESCQ